jgi:hypothetical protein
MVLMPAPDYAVELAALEAGMATGEATIESDGDRVTYRSVAEIMVALSYFRQRAADACGPRTRSASTFATFYPE